MAKRGAQGVRGINLPEWLSSRGQGLFIGVSASVNGANRMGVFNGSANDAFLIYDIDVFAAAHGNTFCYFGTVFGNPGTVWNEATPVTYTPSDPRTGDMGLVPWFLNTPQLTGNLCGGVFCTVFNGSDAFGSIHSSHPLIVVPPGYSGFCLFRNGIVGGFANMYGVMVRNG